MPLGINQNNTFFELAMDVWQKSVFYNEKEYPAGYFATSILNISMDEIYELLLAGDTVMGQFLKIVYMDKEELGAILPSLKEQLLTLAELLWKQPPFCFHDKDYERRMIEVMLAPETLNDISKPESRGRDFFLRYLSSMSRIPPAIYHFAAAGRFFELDYLRRLKKRNETYFAVAAHDCFNSELFWYEMNSLYIPDTEPFTVNPELKSTYVFARNPKNEQEMVFVNRYYFERFISFYTFDLLNGLRQGHAPSECQCCGKFFLTTNGHKPKYCDGIAPQDNQKTCRQYGTAMHQKEQNEQHPIYRIFKTRTDTIRKHRQREKISDELMREALYIAEVYRDKALMDNNYAANGYEQDMEQEHVYEEARKRLK